MKILVIVAHPCRESFNHAIAWKAAGTLKMNGHEVILHDLYEENFDPRLTCGEIPKNSEMGSEIKRHTGELAESQGLIFVHPNWWGQPPALLTGWIDRVLRPGVAYEFMEGDGGEGVPSGLLRGKRALVINTSNTPHDRETGFFGDPLDAIWKKCIFEFCGITDYFRKTFSVIVTSTHEMRCQWLSEVAGMVNDYFPRETG